MAKTKKAPKKLKKSKSLPKQAKAASPAPPAVKGKGAGKVKGRGEKGEVTASRQLKDPSFMGPVPDKPMPRATKLPAPGAALTKREMELVLTAGSGRGVAGEGSLKGRLLVKDGFPYLTVVGRDKRELWFLLQGPDQEVLPAYVEHRVSVSGLIRKTTNYGGTVDVRKYSAKKPEEEIKEQAPVEEKLKFLSPGEVEQLCSAGMGAGMKGFAALRGHLEMTGDDYFLVVSNGGTRQQVSFVLEGKGAKGLRKHLGFTVMVNGVVEKTSGWGGTVQTENVEPRSGDVRPLSRDSVELVQVEGAGQGGASEVKVNHGLTVTLQERAGYTWAIEPTMAKRIGLRDAQYQPHSNGPASREFFFTPRTPGVFDVEFFLAKALTPSQVSKVYRLNLTVKPA